MSRFRSYETDRLRIVPTTTDDAPLILELLNSSKWLEFIGDRNVHSLEDAYTYIQERIVPQFDRLGYGNYTLVLKSDGSKIGACGLYDHEGVDGIDIGFALLPDFEKKGYACEAASKMIEIATLEFKLHTIRAITLIKNMDSRKLLEKLGLTYEKTIRLAGDKEDVMVYHINLL
jgi:RimJ/RimL family protein N-acetyltransferase